MDIIAELKKLLEILTTVFENMYATATHFFVVLFTSRFVIYGKDQLIFREIIFIVWSNSKNWALITNLLQLHQKKKKCV